MLFTTILRSAALGLLTVLLAFSPVARAAPKDIRITAAIVEKLRACEKRGASADQFRTFAQIDADDAKRRASIDPVKDCGFTATDEYAAVELRVKVAILVASARQRLAENSPASFAALKARNERAWSAALKDGSMTQVDVDQARETTKRVEANLKRERDQDEFARTHPVAGLDVRALSNDNTVAEMREYLERQVAAGDITAATRDGKMEAFLVDLEEMRKLAALQQPLSDAEIALFRR